jgi:hypothetical protein
MPADFVSYSRKNVFKQAVKQGRPETPKNKEEIERINKEKEICLNCPKKTCSGSCFRFIKARDKLQQRR